MAFAGMNYLAIVVAAAAAFVFGGFWYGALSKPWMAAAKVDPAALPERNPATKAIPFLVAIAGELVMAYVMAGLIGHLGAVTLRTGLISAAIVWAGFVMPTLATNHGFQGAPWTLTLIDGGHWLGVLLIIGAVIGLMGV